MAYENATEWTRKHVSRVREIKREWNIRHPEQKRAIAKNYMARPEIKSRSREYQSLYRQVIRTEVLEAYGGKCECCGETEKDFLCMDHINGGGHADLKSRGKGWGYSWYLYLKKEHPLHVRVLCHNCNFAMGHYGSCPHQRAAKSKTSL